jgi:small subunit ribosomal protein S3
MKTLVREAKKAGVKGIKIKVSGRLNGAEMARSESESFGKLPLQTIRIPIDYYYTQAYTIFGILGIKIWVYS